MWLLLKNFEKLCQPLKVVLSSVHCSITLILSWLKTYLATSCDFPCGRHALQELTRVIGTYNKILSVGNVFRSKAGRRCTCSYTQAYVYQVHRHLAVRTHRSINVSSSHKIAKPMPRFLTSNLCSTCACSCCVVQDCVACVPWWSFHSSANWLYVLKKHQICS